MSRIRRPGIDRIRGLAIILMMVDHVLVACSTLGVTNDGLMLTRLSLTRLALPLFLLVSGALWVEQLPRPRRLGSVIAAAVALNVGMAVYWPEFSTPEVLVVWSLAAVAAPIIVRHPLAMITLGYIQWQHWQVAWDGYQPGIVVLFLAVGALASRAGLTPGMGAYGRLLPAPLGALGRKPLTWYVGHLTALTVLVAIVR